MAEYVLQQLIDTIKPLPLSASILLLDVFKASAKLDKACDFAKKLLIDYPEDPKVLRASASVQQLLGNSANSLGLLEKALEINKDLCPTYNQLGHLYISMSDKIQAEKSFKKAINSGPNRIGGYWGLVRVLGGDTPEKYILAVKKLENKLKGRHEELAYLNFTLAKYYEERDSKKSFTFFKKGNLAIGKIRPWNFEQESARVEKLINFFSADRLKELHAKHHSDYKAVFIASMPRSGTTLLGQILSAHSQLQSVGESDAFDRAVSAVSVSMGRYPDVYSWTPMSIFETMFKKIDEAFINSYLIKSAKGCVVDKSMSNSFHIGLILSIYPQARVIWLQRDPLDTVLSCYQQLFDKGNAFAFDLSNLAHYYQLNNKIMKHWSLLFPKQILMVNYEALVSDQEAEAKRIIDFIGLEWEQGCLKFYESNEVINTASDLQVKQPIYNSSVGKWRPYAKDLEEAALILGVDVT